MNRMNQYKSGIYLIRCINTGNIYIGESRNMFKRWQSHFDELIKKSYKGLWQEDFNNHGSQSFTFEIVESIDNDFLRKEREKEIIKKYRPIYNTSHNPDKIISSKKQKNIIKNEIKNKKDEENLYLINENNYWENDKNYNIFYQKYKVSLSFFALDLYHSSFPEHNYSYWSFSLYKDYKKKKHTTCCLNAEFNNKKDDSIDIYYSSEQLDRYKNFYNERGRDDCWPLLKVEIDNKIKEIYIYIFWEKQTIFDDTIKMPQKFINYLTQKNYNKNYYFNKDKKL